ncbi:baseplate J/gp47 family protein [Domibacillus iocasae]|uniref:Baseplate protein J-like barrel domain-containing protein n=1 Tax=Domibacillus iocasae TaxID=1714016 RepID=A0A1E7DQ74_9BACI|nr:baseplate J/gp47 family protein [Domibacillus iocasae]OES45221.1 hypothetical protein BA724_04225 [Domibacillus iocasae]
MALDKNGYKRKTYDELLTEMQTRAKELFGENTNVSNRSVIGILLRIMAWFLSLVWEDNEDVYYSASINSATGASLDRLLPYGGISRNSEGYAEGPLLINGTPNYTLLQGFQVTNPSDVFFETIEDVTLDANGSGTVTIRAVEPGITGNVGVGQVTIIVNPDANIDSVTNPEETANGREKETDTESKDRYAVSVEGLGSATLPSVRANLLKLPGVRAAQVIENYTMETVNGQPAKSIQAFVLGGIDQEIAETVFTTKAGGIEPFGTITKTVLDLSGYEHIVRFSRAEEVLIRIRVTIQKNNAFPADGGDQVRSALVRFIGGEDISGALYAGLSMGDDVIYSRIIAQIYKVEGIDDVQLELSADGINYVSSNIAIGLQQVAQTDSDFIEVTANV